MMSKRQRLAERDVIQNDRGQFLPGKRQRPEQKAFRCSQCGKQFRNLFARTIHYEQQHQK